MKRFTFRRHDGAVRHLAVSTLTVARSMAFDLVYALTGNLALATTAANSTREVTA